MNSSHVILSLQMWHSIQSVFQLMEKTAAANGITYTTVAMLRSDVVYVTPIDIMNDSGAVTNGEQLSPVTIPNFGNHPVSDRIAYGPMDAVKIWATERFNHLEQHVRYVQQNDPGWGMHSERFLNTTIFPLIRNVATIRQHPTLCFFRARADESAWVSDCEGGPEVSAPSIAKALGKDLRAVVERTIGRRCLGGISKLRRNVRSLDCSSPTAKTAR
jgi:hypothetical protein